MYQLARAVVFVGFMWIFLYSCASLKEASLEPGEVRLVDIKVPETMQHDLPYDVEVTFAANGYPQIKKVCFRLLDQRISGPAASLTCFSWEVEANKSAYANCKPWESPYTHISELTCTSAQNVSFGKPNRFFAKIPSGFLKGRFNKLECRVEYVSLGAVKESGDISVPVRIEE